MLGRKCEFPRNLRTGPISPPRLEQRCTVVVYGLPRYQRGPFGEWDAGVSDGRQQRHTPDAALRIHVRVGKLRLVLKTQTEEHASALSTSGRGSLLGTSDVMCGMCLCTKTGTVIEYALGSCRGRKKVAQVRNGHGPLLFTYYSPLFVVRGQCQ
jgi:hypothetical protein